MFYVFVFSKNLNIAIAAMDGTSAKPLAGRHAGVRSDTRWLLLVAALSCCAGPGCDSSPGVPDAAAQSSLDEGASLETGRAETAETLVAGSPAATEPPLSPVDRLHPKVEFVTSLGRFVVELDAERAPLTVDNFLSYVDSGHYDQTVFHQVIRDYVILGGAYTASGEEKPAAVPIRNEAHNGLKNLRGTIAMARQADAIDSSTCQFFINLRDNPGLDHTGTTAEQYGYCVFGRVIEGFDTVERIANVEVGQKGDFTDAPLEPVVIRSVRRVRTPTKTAARKP